MSQPSDNPLMLSTGRDESVKPIPLALEGYPTEVEIKVGGESKKIPVGYFDKAVVSEGEYVHPVTGDKFPIDKHRIDHWIQVQNEMAAAGEEIPAPIDHSEKAEDNRGFNLKFHREGGTLKTRMQVFGDDGALLALRNRCSPYVVPVFKGPKTGRVWKDVITHVAFTPHPVFSGNGPFVPFAASRGQRGEPIYYLAAPKGDVPMELNLAELRKKIGADSTSADQAVIDQAAKMIEDKETALAFSRTSQQTKDEKLAAETKRANDAEEKAAAFSRSIMDETTAAREASFFDREVDWRLKQGLCTTAQADKAKQSVRENGKPVGIAFSRISNQGSVANAILELFDMNKPFTGSHTTVQRIADPNADTDVIAAARAEGEAYRQEQLKARGMA